MTTTRTIAGREFSLQAGRRYLANRPTLSFRSRGPVEVSITDITDAGFRPGLAPACKVATANRAEADHLLGEFNDGDSGLDGREW